MLRLAQPFPHFDSVEQLNEHVCKKYSTTSWHSLKLLGNQVLVPPKTKLQSPGEFEPVIKFTKYWQFKQLMIQHFKLNNLVIVANNYCYQISCNDLLKYVSPVLLKSTAYDYLEKTWLIPITFTDAYINFLTSS